MQTQSFNGKSMKKPPQRFNPFYRESGYKKPPRDVRGGVSEVLLFLWIALHAEEARIRCSGIDGNVIGLVVTDDEVTVVRPTSRSEITGLFELIGEARLASEVDPELSAEDGWN
jgi:hypothetical protein